MLAQSAMLVSLRISQIGLSTKSDPVTNAAHTAYGITDPRAGYYRKFKIDSNDVKDISSAANRARSYHRMVTVPWGHDNYRMLPATLVQKYSRKIKGFKLEFESHVKDLTVRWPSIIKSSQARLGPAFNKADYPNESHLEKMCSFEIHFKPVPQDDHFILKVESETLKEIKQDFKIEEENNLKIISQNLWERLYELVQRMAERLSEQDPRIYKTLISNIEELVDILPDLNLGNDPKLAEMCTEAKAKLTIFTPGQLKKDKRARDATAKEAKAIQSKMEAIMGKS